jgi:hypothetical protein
LDDTRLYEKTLQDVQELVAEIEAEELTAAGPVFPQESRITLLVEPTEAGYRDTVQFFGLVTPAGESHQVRLLLDSSGFMTTPTDLLGNYRTSYTVERISAGDHVISAGAGNLTPAERVLTVIKSGTVTSLSAEPARAAGTGAACNGSVLANHPVRNALVKILVDGSTATEVMTAEDGTFQAFLQLPPGSYTLRAEFSADGYPLFPSASDEVTIDVPSRPFSLPGTSPDTPFIVYGAAALVLLGAGSAAAWYVRRGRRAPPAEVEKEPAEAVLIRTELQDIINDAMRELPAAGSEREAALETAINTLLERYAAALGEHGLSEAARQAYHPCGQDRCQHPPAAYRSLTPRESATCRPRPMAPCLPFCRYHERIRYAGSESDQDKRGFFNRFVGIYERIRSSASRDSVEPRPAENEEGPS